MPDLGIDAPDRHITPPLDELNATQTIDPDTDPRMACRSSVTDGSPNSASTQSRRGQEVGIYSTCLQRFRLKTGRMTPGTRR